jgi:hypothetical protein
VATSLKLIQFLHPSELKGVARNKNVNTVIQLQAKRMMQPQIKKPT